jgi:hypothetical protein
MNLKEYEEYDYPRELHSIKENLNSIKGLLNRCLNEFSERNDKEFLNYFARNVVDMSCELFIGYRMLKLSVNEERKRVVTRFFVEKAMANAIKLAEPVLKRHTTAITNRNVIMEV